MASSRFARLAGGSRPTTWPTRCKATVRICSAWAFDGFDNPQDRAGSSTWNGQTFVVWLVMGTTVTAPTEALRRTVRSVVAHNHGRPSFAGLARDHWVEVDSDDVAPLHQPAAGTPSPAVESQASSSELAQSVQASA